MTTEMAENKTALLRELIVVLEGQLAENCQLLNDLNKRPYCTVRQWNQRVIAAQTLSQILEQIERCLIQVISKPVTQQVYDYGQRMLATVRRELTEMREELSNDDD